MRKPFSTVCHKVADASGRDWKDSNSTNFHFKNFWSEHRVMDSEKCQSRNVAMQRDKSGIALGQVRNDFSGKLFLRLEKDAMKTLTKSDGRWTFKIDAVADFCECSDREIESVNMRNVGMT
jgi:hypothetical protein